MLLFTMVIFTNWFLPEAKIFWIKLLKDFVDPWQSPGRQSCCCMPALDGETIQPGIVMKWVYIVSTWHK